MKIVWDEPKRLANIEKHGLDFGRLDMDFFIASMIVLARGSRWKAIGMLDGRYVSVIFRQLGTEAISIVSMRPASAGEVRLKNG